MANLRMTLLDLLNKSEQGADPNFLRDGVQLLAQELMDAEVTDLVGAEPHQRTAGRTTYRNGYRDREWDTRVGTLELQIPKLRQGTYFPSLLEPRRRHERALLSVVQEAYIHGVSTRAVDNLAEALGIKSISKDQVSRICKELDAQVHAFRTRRLDGEFPYLFLDATFEKVRENGRVISMAVLIAVGVRSTGEREVVGVDVGPAEDHEFWLQFLRQLSSRGLSGVRLVISDSHLGLKQAVAQVFVGATWQRCRVHFMRNALATVHKVAQQMVVATLRTVFAQPDQSSAHETIERICRLSKSAIRSWSRLSWRLRSMSSPSTAFRSSTGVRSGRPTRSSVSTKRSAGVAMWLASFPTVPRSCARPARCSRSRTMSGRSVVATSAPSR